MDIRANGTERVSITVVLWTLMREMLYSNLGQDPVYPEVFRGFLRLSRKMPAEFFNVGRSRFLPDPLQFDSHETLK
jgi:hypothetical protein